MYPVHMGWDLTAFTFACLLVNSKAGARLFFARGFGDRKDNSKNSNQPCSLELAAPRADR